jgi:hypothetical protein
MRLTRERRVFSFFLPGLTPARHRARIHRIQTLMRMLVNTITKRAQAYPSERVLHAARAIRCRELEKGDKGAGADAEYAVESVLLKWSQAAYEGSIPFTRSTESASAVQSCSQWRCWFLGSPVDGVLPCPLAKASAPVSTRPPMIGSVTMLTQRAAARGQMPSSSPEGRLLSLILLRLLTLHVPLSLQRRSRHRRAQCRQLRVPFRFR